MTKKPELSQDAFANWVAKATDRLHWYGSSRDILTHLRKCAKAAFEANDISLCATAETLINNYGISRSSVCRNTRWLREHGHIEMISFVTRGTTSCYYVPVKLEDEDDE